MTSVARVLILQSGSPWQDGPDTGGEYRAVRAAVTAARYWYALDFLPVQAAQAEDVLPEGPRRRFGRTSGGIRQLDRYGRRQPRLRSRPSHVTRDTLLCPHGAFRVRGAAGTAMLGV